MQDGPAVLADDNQQQIQVIELSDEQFLAEVEKRTGVKSENIDGIKEKLTYTKPGPDPTEAEKEQAAKNFEKRMLDVHIASGKTPEQYTLLKSIANGDLKELSHNKAVAELKEAGFNEAEIKEAMKARYFQIDDAEIELEDDEEKKAFLKKSKEVFTKRLDTKAAHIQSQAKSYIESLTSQVNESDAEKKRMEQHTSNVEDAIKSYQRKQTLELGKVDDIEIPPIDLEVPESALDEVKELLKDPEKLENLLYNKDGNINLEFLLPHLVRSASYKNVVKHGYLTGGTRQVEHFESIMGKSVPTLGGVKPPDSSKGAVASKGKSTFVAPAN